MLIGLCPKDLREHLDLSVGGPTVHGITGLENELCNIERERERERVMGQAQLQPTLAAQHG